jgi:anthranilate synthase component I
MKAPFDIAGDLDTPVSTYMKLAAFRPCFLLESVEGGERLARYSFVGFGDALEVKLDAAGLQVGTKLHARPANAADLLSQLRAALAAAPRPEPEISGVPLAGGLVGYASYDVVRFFEHLPKRVATADGVPALHYVAPRSLLVFDHLTRTIALLHAGSPAERASLRLEIIQALRGGLPKPGRPGRYQPPTPSMTRDRYMAGVTRIQEYIAAGDVYQLVLASRFSGRHELDPFQAYRALRLINPSPYMYYCALGNITVVGSSPEALVKLNAGQA